jgi:hypothetical protein
LSWGAPLGCDLYFSFGLSISRTASVLSSGCLSILCRLRITSSYQAEGRVVAAFIAQQGSIFWMHR